MTDIRTILSAIKNCYKKIIVFSLVSSLIGALLGGLYILSGLFGTNDTDNSLNEENATLSLEKVSTTPASSDPQSLFSSGLSLSSESKALLEDIRISYADKVDMEAVNQLYVEQTVLVEIGLSNGQLKNMAFAHESDIYEQLTNDTAMLYDAVSSMNAANDYEKILISLSERNLYVKKELYNNIDEYSKLYDEYSLETAKAYYTSAAENYNKIIDILTELFPDSIIIKNESKGNYVFISGFSEDTWLSILLSCCVIGFLSGFIYRTYTAIYDEEKKLISDDINSDKP